MKNILKNEIVLLLIIVFIAGFFRFYNLNWDEKSLFHPDERNIANAVTKIHFFSELNPQFFAYGGLTIYLDRATADLINLLTRETVWTTDWGNINIISRTWSAFFSTLAVFPLFFLVKRLFGRRTAFLSIILYTLTVTLIQSAHFGTTESILVLFLMLIAYTATEVLANPTLQNFLILGLLCGLATATKTSALSFLIFPTVVFYIIAKKNRHYPWRLASIIGLFGLITIVSFTLFSPYTFLSWDKFSESMNYESSVSTGRFPVVYTLQFKDTLPYLYQMKNLLWQMGPAAIVSLIGLILLLKRLLLKRELKVMLLLAFPLAYFIYVGSWYAKFIRYMVPIVPFLIIFTAYALDEVIKRFKTLGWWITSLTIFVTAIWAISFLSIYTRPQTKLLATQWIYQNIPQGSLILQEHWDDGLPIPFDNFSPSLYKIYQLSIYEPDGPSKVDYYSTWLSEGDYLVLSSRRLYGTLIHRPDRYPLTSFYYYLLFSDKLGYQKIAEFSSYPQIGKWTINDDLSEETFQVFDHPKVMIFKNTQHLSSTQIHAELTRSTLAWTEYNLTKQ